MLPLNLCVKDGGEADRPAAVFPGIRLDTGLTFIVVSYF